MRCSRMRHASRLWARHPDRLLCVAATTAHADTIGVVPAVLLVRNLVWRNYWKPSAKTASLPVSVKNTALTGPT